MVEVCNLDPMHMRHMKES